MCGENRSPSESPEGVIAIAIRFFFQSASYACFRRHILNAKLDDAGGQFGLTISSSSGHSGSFASSGVRPVSKCPHSSFDVLNPDHLQKIDCGFERHYSGIVALTEDLELARTL